MSRSMTEIIVHFVWATKKREPILTAQWEPVVYKCIQNECRRLKCTVLALGGLKDHVHLLAVVPSHVPVCDLMRQVKGVSARFANGELPLTVFLQWQEGYSALSIGRSDEPRVRQYILCQKQRHVESNLWQSLEQNADD